MGMLIGMDGFIGFFVFLILFIVNLIKKEPKKPAGIGMTVCVVLFFVGVAITPTSSEKEGKEPDHTDTPPSQVVETTEPTPPPEEPSPSIEPIEETIPIEPTTPSTPPENTIDLDTLMAVLRVTIAQNFGENNYTLEYDSTAATINLWGDNIALGATLAASGDADAKEAWSTMIDGQKTLCNGVVEQVESIGLEDYLVMVNVLNDLDKSKTLLSILNGVVVYDVVNG